MLDGDKPVKPDKELEKEDRVSDWIDVLGPLACVAGVFFLMGIWCGTSMSKTMYQEKCIKNGVAEWVIDKQGNASVQYDAEWRMPRRKHYTQQVDRMLEN